MYTCVCMVCSQDKEWSSMWLWSHSTSTLLTSTCWWTSQAPWKMTWPLYKPCLQRLVRTSCMYTYVYTISARNSIWKLFYCPDILKVDWEMYVLEFDQNSAWAFLSWHLTVLSGFCQVKDCYILLWALTIMYMYVHVRTCKYTKPSQECQLCQPTNQPFCCVHAWEPEVL